MTLTRPLGLKLRPKGPLGGRDWIPLIDVLEQYETWLVASEYVFGSRERFLETRARISTYERHGRQTVKVINVRDGALFVRVNE